MKHNGKVSIVSIILFFACLTSIAAKAQKSNGNNIEEIDLQSLQYDKLELVSSNVNRSVEISKEYEMKNVATPFEKITFKVSDNETINWTVKSEQVLLPYLVEHFVFDRWVKVAEVKGNGLPEIQVYSVPVVMNSGDNKIRVNQKGADGKNHFSKVIHFYCAKKQVIYTLVDRNTKLEFSNITYFIVYNPYGEIINKGSANSIDISNYSKGKYCIIYDNKVSSFNKR